MVSAATGMLDTHRPTVKLGPGAESRILDGRPNAEFQRAWFLDFRLLSFHNFLMGRYVVINVRGAIGRLGDAQCINVII